MAFFVPLIPIAITGTVVVVGSILYLASEEVTEYVEDTTEEIGLLINQILYAGYALVFGFPGYLIDSLAHNSVGFIDPLRYTWRDYPTTLSIGLQRTTLFEFVEDTVGYLHVPNVGLPPDDIVGNLVIKGTPLPIESVLTKMVIPRVP